MKKFFLVLMLGYSTMVCSCQKQNSAAEQQLAQRKSDLDAREQALDEREQALVAREQVLTARKKALTEKENAMRTEPVSPTTVQGQPPDAAQLSADQDSRIQQLPPELRAFIRDRSQVSPARGKADPGTQERRIQSPDDLDQLQKQRQLEAMQKWKMSGASGSSTAQVSSPTPSPV